MTTSDPNFLRLQGQYRIAPSISPRLKSGEPWSVIVVRGYELSVLVVPAEARPSAIPSKSICCLR